MHTPKNRFGKLLRRFNRGQSGSVAVEFGLLALPFAAVLFAVLESCISFASQQVLANATDDIARRIRTGQTGWRNPSEADLKNAICARLDIMVGSGCQSRLTVDLRSFDTYAEGAAIKIKIVNEVLDTSDFQFDPGGSGTRNMLRVFYRWPVLTDFMRMSMANIKDPNNQTDRAILHFATTTWKNEPY